MTCPSSPLVSLRSRSTTIHAVNSCVLKLSKLTQAVKVWRGFKGATLPREFWEPNDAGVRGGIEYGFSSTTTDRSQAVIYASGSQSTVFEMQMGMVRPRPWPTGDSPDYRASPNVWMPHPPSSLPTLPPPWRFLAPSPKLYICQRRPSRAPRALSGGPRCGFVLALTVSPRKGGEHADIGRGLPRPTTTLCTHFLCGDGCARCQPLARVRARGAH